jgi:DnaJ-class molecular chaperone
MSSSLWHSRHDYFNCTQYHEKRQHQTRGVVKDAYASSFGEPYLLFTIYHPDKHGMSDEEAVEFFQHLNNAHSYLLEIM